MKRARRVRFSGARVARRRPVLSHSGSNSDPDDGRLSESSTPCFCNLRPLAWMKHAGGLSESSLESP